LTLEDLPWWWVHIAVLAAAYVLGSIPFSYLVARHKGVDVRTVGSGNVGATNVMRSAGRAAGVLAFLLDFAKGAAASALAVRLIGGATLPAAAAVVAVVGHMYPVWLRFRGGKGVATGAGAFAPLAPAATVCALVVFAAVLLLSRYVSVGSIAGTVSLSALAYLTGRPHPIPLAAAGLAALIVWKHRENVRRLWRGTENRLGRNSPAPHGKAP
jgi:glycerol-3-phosphate acyltransferase PlsY